MNKQVLVTLVVGAVLSLSNAAYAVRQDVAPPTGESLILGDDDEPGVAARTVSTAVPAHEARNGVVQSDSDVSGESVLTRMRAWLERCIATVRSERVR